jgi:hypothetical protein
MDRIVLAQPGEEREGILDVPLRAELELSVERRASSHDPTRYHDAAAVGPRGILAP